MEILNCGGCFLFVCKPNLSCFTLNFKKKSNTISFQFWNYPWKLVSTPLNKMLSKWCMWELDHKEGWVPKNWCFWIAVMEKILGSSLDSKEIKVVHPKGNQPWIFIGRTDAEVEAPIPWSPDTKSQLIGKDSWCWARLRAGGVGGDRGCDGWMASIDMSLSKLREIVKDREACCAAAHGVTKSWTWLSNWTTKVLKRWLALSFMTIVCLFLLCPAFRSLLLITLGLVLFLDFWLLILPQIFQINWMWKLVQMMFRIF